MSDPSEGSPADQGHPLSGDQIELIKDSWRRLAPRLPSVATAFYQRLFEIDPGLQPMFDGVEIEAQGKKFIDTISFVVKGIDHFEWLGPAIGELGRRHAGYGVEDIHYASIREAMIETFATELGDSFSESTRQAWKTVFDVLAEIMKAGPPDGAMSISPLT